VKPSQGVLHTATGEIADSQGKITLKIQIGDVEVEQEAWVAPIQDDLILGLDFLRATKSHLDLEADLLMLGRGGQTFQIAVIGQVPQTGVLEPPGENSEAPIPEMLAAMCTRAVEHLTSSQGEMVRQLVVEFIEVFSTGPDDIGCTSVVQHHIDTGKARPIRQAPYRLPIHKKAAAEKELQRMKEAGVIVPSMSPWASPAILVPKKDGSTRFCVDLRRLNEVTIKDAHPIPRVDDALDNLAGSRWFSTLDLRSGYWQVQLHRDSRGENSVLFGTGALGIHSNGLWTL